MRRDRIWGNNTYHPESYHHTPHRLLCYPKLELFWLVHTHYNPILKNTLLRYVQARIKHFRGWVMVCIGIWGNNTYHPESYHHTPYHPLSYPMNSKGGYTPIITRW